MAPSRYGRKPAACPADQHGVSAPSREPSQALLNSAKQGSGENNSVTPAFSPPYRIIRSGCQTTIRGAARQFETSHHRCPIRLRKVPVDRIGDAGYNTRYASVRGRMKVGSGFRRALTVPHSAWR